MALTDSGDLTNADNLQVEPNSTSSMAGVDSRTQVAPERRNDWAEHAIWWQVYPLGFTGAPIRPADDGERAFTPRLARIIPWLDYLIELGANGLLLGPIFTSQTHGYDTTDYYSIDPRLGDESTFDELVSACHTRGIRLMLDGVFNHVGSAHPWFRQALAGQGHEHDFIIRRGDNGAVDFTVFEGHGDLPELNHDSPEVARLVGDVMRYWLKRGADAWRLDAAYAVPPKFWTHVLPDVRRDFPDAWFMGEVIHGDYAAIVARSGMDSLTQYELWKAVWSSIKNGNFYELDWSLKRHNDFMESFTPQTFIGNHDVTRIASQVGQAGAALAAAVLFTLAGAPSVYYGDEWGYEGVKEDRIGGDDAVRPQFPQSPRDLPEGGRRMFRIYQDLIALRRRNPWLATATTNPTAKGNRSYSYDALGTAGERLHVKLALDPTPHADIYQGPVHLLHIEY